MERPNAGDWTTCRASWAHRQLAARKVPLFVQFLRWARQNRSWSSYDVTLIVLVFPLSLAASPSLCKAAISCWYAKAMRSSAVTVPSPFASIGSVDAELELAEDVLLLPLVLLVEEVALDDAVA